MKKKPRAARRITPETDLAEVFDDEPLDPCPPGVRVVELGGAHVGERLDRALTDKLPEMSRARLQALLASGMVSFEGRVLDNASAKVRAGLYTIEIPPAIAAEPLPENIPLDVLFEDEHLIVVNKAAGMTAHPAPGSETGTLVNALLHHCGASLSGIGGVARPGIVHRLDRETSGVMVAAKTDQAHHGLAKLFEAHDIDRVYIALTRSAPPVRAATVTTRIGRSKTDRKKMAVLASGGREAITHYKVEKTFGISANAGDVRPLAARISCTLETGRTHQIRVHLASKGAPVLCDALYGSGQPAMLVREKIKAAGLFRHALHAAVLGFTHPITGEVLRFETPLPADMAALEAGLLDV